jgi:ADP-ribose pyrophosphatase
MNLKWDVIASQLAWRGRFPVVIDRLRAREDGREMDYTYLKLSGGAVTVLGLDGDNQAICVRQYRHPTGQVMLELPAGHVDRGETPTDCAHREFEEETGLRIGELQSLGSFVPVPALSGFRMHMFIGRDLYQGQAALEETEILEVVRVPIRELREQILSDRHDHAGMISTVLIASQRGLIPE